MTASLKQTKWTDETIAFGIHRYIQEKGVMPSAVDFDETPYLPSARQVQRAFGGIVALRERLGYEGTDFTRGSLRAAIAANGNKRGLGAEETFEPLLIAKFGEPFVHTQKRYYRGSKYRYDFLVYADGITFGIDIFTTDRASYIEKNIRHKVQRYKNAPLTLPIYFVLVGPNYTQNDISKAAASVSELRNYSNMHLIHETQFVKFLEGLCPLKLPENYIDLETLEFS